jgi:hypothetical protein
MEIQAHSSLSYDTHVSSLKELVLFYHLSLLLITTLWLTVFTWQGQINYCPYKYWVNLHVKLHDDNSTDRPRHHCHLSVTVLIKPSWGTCKFLRWVHYCHLTQSIENFKIVEVFKTGYILFNFVQSKLADCRSQWPRGLTRRSGAARLLGLWVRIPVGAWMFVSCECCQVEVSATSWSLVQGVLPTVVRRCVWSGNLVNEEVMTRVGSQRHRKKC